MLLLQLMLTNDIQKCYTPEQVHPLVTDEKMTESKTEQTQIM